jgi:hypothetical protein
VLGGPVEVVEAEHDLVGAHRDPSTDRTTQGLKSEASTCRGSC